MTSSTSSASTSTTTVAAKTFSASTTGTGFSETRTYSASSSSSTKTGNFGRATSPAKQKISASEASGKSAPLKGSTSPKLPSYRGTADKCKFEGETVRHFNAGKLAIFELRAPGHKREDIQVNIISKFCLIIAYLGPILH